MATDDKNAASISQAHPIDQYPIGPAPEDDRPSDNFPSNVGSPVDGRSITSPPKDNKPNVDNPLETIGPSVLDDQVKEFVDKAKGLGDHLEILKQGAQLARDRPYALKTNKETLSDKQLEYFQYDKKGKDGESRDGFLKQSKFLQGSLLSTCLAGIVQGWTQSAINGAGVGIRQDFHLQPNGDNRKTKDLWVFGMLMAIPFLTGGFLAPLVSDPLQEHYLGRRGAIAVACVLSIIATIGQSFSKSPGQLAGWRVITGLTLAAKASTAPLLIAEVSPKHLRGQLLSTWQLSDAFGIFLGFASNLAITGYNAPDRITWRIETAAVLVPTVALLAVVYLMPESPRFLMKQKKHRRALESFTFLRPSPVSALLAARDLMYAHFQLETECKFMEDLRGNPKYSSANLHDMPSRLAATAGSDPEKPKTTTHWPPLYDIEKTNYFQRLCQTFRDDRSRRALVCASTAMIAQQLTGINTIVFLSATLLDDAHASNRTGAWVGFGLGICNFLFGTPAFWLLDRVGRAAMLLLGFVPMFVLMLILAFCFTFGTNGDPHVPLVGVFGVLYIIAYSSTAGPTPFAISAEVFPLVVREVGHSLAVAVNFISLGFVLLIFPPLSSAMGGHKARTTSGYKECLSLFAALNLLALVLCFLFVPETKGRTLEELQYTFDLPTKIHIKYRVKYVTSWLAKKYLRSRAIKVHLWPKEKDKPVEDLIPFYLWGRINYTPPNNPPPGNPTPDNPTPGNPTTGDPTPGDTTSGYPTSGNPTDPTPGNPTTGDPIPGDPTPGNPTPGNPTPGNPTPSNPNPRIPTING